LDLLPSKEKRFLGFLWQGFFCKKKAQRGEPLHFQASVEAFRTIVIFNSKGKKLEPFDGCYSITYAAPCLSFFLFFLLQLAPLRIKQRSPGAVSVCLPSRPHIEDEQGNGESPPTGENTE
jgi:hypothetical protein